MKLLRFEQLSAKLGGRSRPSIHRDMKNRNFPQPIHLGIGGAVAWDEEAVDNWLKVLAETPYTPKQVAVPAPGKRRGRPRKSASGMEG